MAERRMPIEDQYPNNSDTARERAKAEEAPKKAMPAKVTKGGVRKRKRPLRQKLAEAFGAREGQGVLEYILCDIIIPATKNMIVDSIIDGAEMAILGETRGRYGRPRSTGGGGYRPYDRVSYRPNDRYGRNDQRDDGRRRANMESYDDILFDTQSDAEEVLSQMIDIIDNYGQVKVTEMYALAGIKDVDYTMGNFGWTNLSAAYAKRIRDGYILSLPRAITLR